MVGIWSLLPEKVTEANVFITFEECLDTCLKYHDRWDSVQFLSLSLLLWKGEMGNWYHSTATSVHCVGPSVFIEVITLSLQFSLHLWHFECYKSFRSAFRSQHSARLCRECKTGWLWSKQTTTDNMHVGDRDSLSHWDAVLDEPRSYQWRRLWKESRCLVSRCGFETYQFYTAETFNPTPLCPSHSLKCFQAVNSCNPVFPVSSNNHLKSLKTRPPRCLSWLWWKIVADLGTWAHLVSFN